jgi:hypothetical protein
MTGIGPEGGSAPAIRAEKIKKRVKNPRLAKFMETVYQKGQYCVILFSGGYHEAVNQVGL